MTKLSEVFPRCRVLLGVKSWQRILGVVGDGLEPADFPVVLGKLGEPGVPPFLTGLARIELACFQVSSADPIPDSTDKPMLNPTLQILPVTWTNLVNLLTSSKGRDLARVKPGNEYILVWREPETGRVRVQVAGSCDLLAIKIVVEELDPDDVACESSVPTGKIDAIIREAVWNGLVLSPLSTLCRETSASVKGGDVNHSVADVFTLQWHLTQECDLHCRHCYDRTNRTSFPFERALKLLDELGAFCRSRFVRGQVSLTGGNPLLYPHFFELYQAAADRELMIAILGNAVERSDLERIVAIRMPVYYQVSLEGLESHNDRIRGEGNYRRTVGFLRMLTEMGVPNMVMLTLTRHNLDQVIPLADELEGVTGGIAFNRLALFGEGAALELPTPIEYRLFLEEYVRSLESHPVLGLKDNLLNTVMEGSGKELFGGCAGYGCGAAFNFVSILSDGEVHACRKFPSPIGNIITESLEKVYLSEAASRYRSGCSACAGCSLNAVCRGCPAITASLGLDPFSERDPYCFRNPS